MSELFYLQDSRSCVGNNVLFWRKGGCGYGTNLNDLEVYSLTSAQCHHSSRNSDIPLLKSLVDEQSIISVDCQVLPESCTTDHGGKYIVQRKGYWNGNDIRFVGHSIETYDYSLAEVFSREEVIKLFSDSESYAVYSKSAMDKVARRTFQSVNIDRRKMITKPGIKLVKPKRVRQTTGKTRGNCPACGRITWDYNPYENAYCPDCPEPY